MNTIHMRTGSHLGQAAGLFAALMLLGACAPLEKKGNQPDIPVNITFDGSHCPKKVDPENPTVNKADNQRLVWQAVDGAGIPIGEKFTIYFDPFRGKTLESGREGYEKSPHFDRDTPVNVEYKYTIVGERCPAEPLDPRFFLN